MPEFEVKIKETRVRVKAINKEAAADKASDLMALNGSRSTTTIEVERAENLPVGSGSEAE